MSWGDKKDREDTFRRFVIEESFYGEERKQQLRALSDLSAQAAEIVGELDGEYRKFEGLAGALPVRDAEALAAMAGRAVFYEITAGLIARGDCEPFLDILDAVCRRRGAPCGRADIARAFAAKEPLFRTEGALTRDECGTFWLKLISRLPPAQSASVEGEPEELAGLIALAESFYSEFAGDAALPPRLYERFAEHRLRFSLLTPDTDKLRDAIRRQDFSDYRLTNPYRDLLTASFPEPGRWWSAEKLASMDEEELLAETYRRDPALAVRMWRLLLDAAGERLGDRPAADRLLSLEIAGHCTRYEAWECGGRFDAILDELGRDDGFARQLYQSASLNGYQANLLIACCVRGRVPLMEHLRELLEQSPYLGELWPGGLSKWVLLLPENTLSTKNPRAKRPRTGPAPLEDAREYRCCSVRFEELAAEYAYLCGDPAVVPGDYVRVPFGRNGAERVGRVMRVGLYTSADAPYPPERMKEVLGRAAEPHPQAPRGEN